MLYFFNSLFDKKKVKKAICQLKVLQDVLGIFNDLCVQTEFLQDYLGYLKGDNIDPTTLNILGSLVDLNKDQSKFSFVSFSLNSK